MIIPIQLRLLISHVADLRLIWGAREKELGSREKIKNDDSQQRFLAQHSVAMLEQCCNYSKNVGERCVALKIVVANRLV